MKLYDRFGAKGFHSSFITTFGIDFDTYKNVCLNRLRGAGCTNNFILPNARMLSYTLDGASVLPRYAGRLYVASGMDTSRGGVFHCKLFLRLGRHSGELLIGSANMTAPGLAGNLSRRRGKVNGGFARDVIKAAIVKDDGVCGDDRLKVMTTLLARHAADLEDINKIRVYD